MLTTLEGVMGSGKTITAVTLAYLGYRDGREIISNIELNFPYTKFDPAFLVDNMNTTELKNCIFLLDEAYLMLDSRNSQAKLTKLFTYFVAQTRKRHVDMLICVHHIDTVDKRLRRAVDIRGTCRFTKHDPCRKCKGETTIRGEVCPECLGYGVSGWAKVSFFNMRTARRSKLRIHAPMYWHFYDTDEIVKTTGKAIQIKEEDL